MRAVIVVQKRARPIVTWNESSGSISGVAASGQTECLDQVALNKTYGSRWSVAPSHKKNIERKYGEKQMKMRGWLDKSAVQQTGRSGSTTEVRERTGRHGKKRGECCRDLRATSRFQVCRGDKFSSMGRINGRPWSGDVDAKPGGAYRAAVGVGCLPPIKGLRRIQYF
jgi:hypothetical protein